MKRAIASVILLLLACTANWANAGVNVDAEPLTPRLLRSVQIGSPQDITVEQITAIVQNGHSAYLDVMLARSALIGSIMKSRVGEV